MQLKRNRKIEFERLKQNHKKQIVIWALAICIIGGALTFATTRAKYRLTESIPLAQGIVNYNPDNIAPTISNITSSTTETTINVTVEASDNVGVTEYWYAIGNGTFTKEIGNTYTFTGLNAGTTYTIKVYAKDKAGNQSTTTTKTITTSDITKPTISNVTTSVTKTEISVTVTATDNVGVTEYWYQIDSKATVKQVKNTYKFTGLTAGSTHTIKVYVKDAAGNQSTTANKSVTTSIPTSEDTLAKLNITSYKTTAPDFSQVATTDEGVYRVSDGMYGGYSYYWRGAVTNNYIKFANFCWRIIRINGDGSIRLIYDGTACHANGTSTTDSLIQPTAATIKYVYNSSYNQSNYVGWSYSGISQRTTGGTVSNAMSKTEDWFRSKITGTNLTKVDTSAKFCNDRDAQSGSTWTINGATFYYAAYKRTITDRQPALACSSGDTYALKVGTITADELMLAGGKNANNTSYYLYSGQAYWTMSPSHWHSSTSYAYVFFVTANGAFSWSNVGSAYGIRPVINLKSDVTFSGGNGTQSNPYVVQ